MNAEQQLAEAAQARLNRTNHWIIQVDKELRQAAELGWPHVHCVKLLEEPEEVQERVIGYYKDLGYQAYRGRYEGGWGHDFPTIWFSSEPAKPKEPGVISQVLHRLFGGSKDRT